MFFLGIEATFLLRSQVSHKLIYHVAIKFYHLNWFI